MIHISVSQNPLFAKSLFKKTWKFNIKKGLAYASPFLSHIDIELLNYLLTASLRALPALNLGAFEAGILTDAPV
jgi:hypothetical protein